MTRHRYPRRGWRAIVLVLLAAAAWLWLAPTQIGGSTSYVTTHGASMEPRFHTGDLALVRPAEHYRVGQIVAYRSGLLNSVVLHRIIARDGDRYVLKGDNNDFVDPVNPGRGEFVGRLWLRVPRAGKLLDWLGSPVIAAVMVGACALLLGARSGRQRHRRRRRGTIKSARQGDRHVIPAPHRIDAQQILTAAGVAIVAFLVLGVLAFARPANRTTKVKIPYTEQASFAYQAQAPRSPVYPTGRVSTGDPVFRRLVQRVRVNATYRLVTAAPHQVTGTHDVALRLMSATGWSRSIQLAAPARFTGDHTSREVTLDLPRLSSLIARVQQLTGGPAGGTYTLTVLSRVRVTGTLGGQPLSGEYRAATSFQLDDLQLRPAGDATTSEKGREDQSNPSRSRTVEAPATTPNRLSVSGHGLQVATARWIAPAGLLLAAFALLSALRHPPRTAAAHIQARYEHLIVPIAAIAPTPRSATVDVTSIDALAKLAQRSERLILHHHTDNTDTYLVDDEGTIYTYRVPPAIPDSP